MMGTLVVKGLYNIRLSLIPYILLLSISYMELNKCKHEAGELDFLILSNLHFITNSMVANRVKFKTPLGTVDKLPQSLLAQFLRSGLISLY